MSKNSPTITAEVKKQARVEDRNLVICKSYLMIDTYKNADINNSTATDKSLTTMGNLGVFSPL